jgi:hypothetical protein
MYDRPVRYRNDIGTNQIIATTVCSIDLDKLNLPMVDWFKLEPFFNTAPAASKNNNHSKSG